MNDQEEAGYILDDLRTCFGKKTSLFLPDSFRKPGTFDEADATMCCCARKRSTHSAFRCGVEIIVTYRSHSGKSVREVLERSTLLIKKGENWMDIFIVRKL